MRESEGKREARMILGGTVSALGSTRQQQPTDQPTQRTPAHPVPTADPCMQMSSHIGISDWQLQADFNQSGLKSSGKIFWTIFWTKVTKTGWNRTIYSQLVLLDTVVLQWWYMHWGMIPINPLYMATVSLIITPPACVSVKLSSVSWTVWLNSIDYKANVCHCEWLYYFPVATFVLEWNESAYT